MAKMGRKREAAAALERALDEFGGNPPQDEILSDLALIYEEIGPDTAFRIYVRAADAYPELASEMLRRAGDLVDGTFADAAASWLEAEWSWLREEPVEAGDSARLMLAATVFSYAKRHAPAVKWLTQAAAGIPESSREEVAEQVYRIGDMCNRENDLDFADAYLRCAVEIDPDHLKAAFLLSEVLRRRSFTDKAPYVNVEYIREAKRVWDAAADHGAPIDSWTCGTRALILEQLGNGVPVDRWSIGWEAVVYAERACLPSTSDSFYSALLGRRYRFLGLAACEDHTTAEVLELAETDEARRAALEERIITTSNSGRFELALELLNAIREFEASTWADAVEAFILVRTGQPERALQLVDALFKDAQAIWCYELRAACFREMSNIDSLKETYRSIWAKYDPEDTSNITAYARAACWLSILGDHVPEVTQILERYRATQAMPTDSDVLLTSGECYLACGDLARGRDLIAAGIRACRSARDLEDARKELRDMAGFHCDRTRGEAINQALDEPGSGIEAAIRDRLAVVRDTAITPESELQALLAERGDADADGWLRMGVLAGIGRMSVAADATELARQSYEKLLAAEPKRFPEAKRVLERLAETAYNSADDWLKSGDYARALDAYRKLASNDLAADLREGILAGIACAQILAGDKDFGKSLHEALVAFQARGELDAPVRLGRRLESLIHNERELWSVWDTCDTQRSPGGPMDASQLRATLLSWLDERYGLDGSGATTITAPVRVFLEMGSGLIPEDTSEKWTLFREYIPEMRDRFLAEMGITLPGVRVRANGSLKADQYAILIDEIPLPLERGQVELGSRYSPVTSERLRATGIAVEHLKEAVNRGTGYRGCWVREPGWAPVEAAGLSLQPEPLVFVIQHLEGVLMRSLHEFLRMDDVETMLTSWQADAAVGDLIKTVLPNAHSRFYFSRLAQMLARQRVPLTRPLDLLGSLRDFRLDARSLPAAVRRVRSALRSSLPGNAPGWLRVYIPEDLEQQALSTGDGTSPTEQTERMVAALRRLINFYPFEPPFQGITLIAMRDRAAAVMRDVAATHFLNVTTLSGEEVHD